VAKTIIGSVIAGTVSDATGLSPQRHLLWAANDNAWWLFYLANTPNNVLKSYRSPDGVTWTAGPNSPPFLTNNLTSAYHGNQGRNFAVAYGNLSSTDVFHVQIGVLNAGATLQEGQHIRATAAAGVLTWGAWAQAPTAGNNAYATNAFPCGEAVVVDTGGVAVVVDMPDSANSPGAAVASTVDSGTSWTPGWSVPTVLQVTTNRCNASAVFDLGSGSYLALWENGAAADPNSLTNVGYSVYSSGAWSAAGNVLLSALGAGVNMNNFGAVDFAPYDIHVVVTDGSNFTHRRYRSGNWINGAPIATPPGFKNGQGVFLASDRIHRVWLFILANDAANTIYVNQWTEGAAWSGWSPLETSTAVRGFLTGWPWSANGQIGLLWQETNGSNYDVAFEAWPTPAYPSALLRTANLGLGAGGRFFAESAV
jgi:hypothetical protein